MLLHLKGRRAVVALLFKAILVTFSFVTLWDAWLQPDVALSPSERSLVSRAVSPRVSQQSRWCSLQRRRSVYSSASKNRRIMRVRAERQQYNETITVAMPGSSRLVHAQPATMKKILKNTWCVGRCKVIRGRKKGTKKCPRARLSPYIVSIDLAKYNVRRRRIVNYHRSLLLHIVCHRSTLVSFPSDSSRTSESRSSKACFLARSHDAYPST
jgi:hypothetical protein